MKEADSVYFKIVNAVCFFAKIFYYSNKIEMKFYIGVIK